VTVYRLVTCGTIEEKMYRRQVFKGGLSRTAMSQVHVTRHFSKDDLRSLLTLGDFDTCETLALLNKQPINILGECDASTALNMVVGLSRHDDIPLNEQAVEQTLTQDVAQNPINFVGVAPTPARRKKAMPDADNPAAAVKGGAKEAPVSFEIVNSSENSSSSSSSSSSEAEESTTSLEEEQQSPAGTETRSFADDSLHSHNNNDSLHEEDSRPSQDDYENGETANSSADGESNVVPENTQPLVLCCESHLNKVD
jgi:hypothetical protein